MSFIFINNENNEIINILEDRRLNQLIRYFMSYVIDNIEVTKNDDIEFTKNGE